MHTKTIKGNGFWVKKHMVQVPMYHQLGGGSALPKSTRAVTTREYTLEEMALSTHYTEYLTSRRYCTSRLASFIAYMYETLCGIKTFHMSIIILQSIFLRISYRMSKYQSRQLRHKNIIGHGPYINILILQCF